MLGDHRVPDFCTRQQGSAAGCRRRLTTFRKIGELESFGEGKMWSWFALTAAMWLWLALAVAIVVVCPLRKAQDSLPRLYWISADDRAE